MRTVPYRLHSYERATRQVPVSEFTNLVWSNGIIRTLQNERGHGQVRQICAIVGQKGYAGEVLCDLRVSAAKAFCEFSGQFRLIFVLHDDGSHSPRPTKMVVRQSLQQAVDVASAEPACVMPVVDVAGRRPNRKSLSEAAGFLVAASTPIIELAEWPTKMSGPESDVSAMISRTSSA